MYTQKKPIDNTHIVRERDRQRNRELVAVLSLGVPIGLFLLLFTWQNLEVIRLGREATRLQNTLKDVEAQHKALQAELDRLTSFDAVEKKATDLGFASTDSKSIVIVDPLAAGRPTTTLQPASVAGPLMGTATATANESVPSASSAAAPEVSTDAGVEDPQPASSQAAGGR